MIGIFLYKEKIASMDFKYDHECSGKEFSVVSVVVFNIPASSNLTVAVRTQNLSAGVHSLL